MDYLKKININYLKYTKGILEERSFDVYTLFQLFDRVFFLFVPAQLEGNKEIFFKEIKIMDIFKDLCAALTNPKN